MRLPLTPLKPSRYAAAASLRHISTYTNPASSPDRWQELPPERSSSAISETLYLHLRHLFAYHNPTRSPVPPPSPLPGNSSSHIFKTLYLLKNTDPCSWPTNSKLQTLLSSLSPPSVLKITRKLPDYQNALQFFNHLKTTSQSDSIFLAFQAVLELAMRESPDSPRKLYELFLLEKEQNTPLSVEAGTVLIKYFSQAKMLDEMIMVFNAIDEEKVNTDVLNLVVAELLKYGRVNDALKLINEMLEPDSHCPPNDDTASIVFSNILKRNWSGRSVTDEEIRNLISNFGEQGVWLNGFLLTEIIRRFCRNGNCDKAWDIFHEAMNSVDVRPWNINPCNAMLTGLAQARDLTRMNLLLKEMEKKWIFPDDVTCGIMINHLCKFRSVDVALKLLEKMEARGLGIGPNIFIYNTLIDGLCKVGRQEEGLKLMERMRLERGCYPNTKTYACLIDGFCKAGMVDKGRELSEQMSKEGVEVNVITLNRMLDGMCRHGRVGSAMEFFSRKGLKGDAVTYTILITSFCSTGDIDNAMKLFNKMRENGYSPDASVYYRLISALTQAGRMDDASIIMSKLKEAGFGLDILSYNILIGGFCRKNRLDKASELLKDMEKAGLKPNRVTYYALLSFFCASGDFTQVHKVMGKMTDDGLKPNVIVYEALIQAYCSYDKLDEAMKIFRDMSSSSKLAPNAVIYNMLIDSLCENYDVEVALSLMDDMKDIGVRQNGTTYNALFKGLHQRNWFEKALEFRDQMTEQACIPDYITMEILTSWLSAVDEIGKLCKFVPGHEVSASTA